MNPRLRPPVADSPPLRVERSPSLDRRPIVRPVSELRRRKAPAADAAKG